MRNYDRFVFQQREEGFREYRRKTIIKYFQTKQVWKEFENMSLESLYEKGSLDVLYSACQSITQHLRNHSGKAFEKIIENIFLQESIPFNKQVKIGHHKVDFVVPQPMTIISAKTTLRERYLQDRYLYNVITITLDHKKCDGDICVVDAEEMNLTLLLKKLKQMTSLKCLDLFCGAGGFSQGFSEAGIDVIAGIDHWDTAIETYQRNHKHLALCQDLSQFSPETFASTSGISSVDLIIGGPPCQGFSIAGRRDATDPRNSLFMAFVDYLNFFRPKAFLMENVLGILSMKTASGEACVNIIMEQLTQHYKVIILKLNASDFQVPQKRRRVIFFWNTKRLEH